MKFLALLVLSSLFLVLCTGREVPGQCGAQEWVELQAIDGAASDWFGWDTCVSGNRVVVGAPLHDVLANNSGAAYVFVKRGALWDEYELTASDGAHGDQFGKSVSLEGDVLVVGADRGDGGNGAAYVFRWDGSSWQQEKRLVASDGADRDDFGFDVAIHGDRILVGAPSNDEKGQDAGAAYVYRYQGGSWVQEQKVTAGLDAAVGDNFGFSVALSGDEALVGAPDDDVVYSASGSAYVFRYEGGSWVKKQRITASRLEAGASFGSDVALTEDRILVGAPNSDDQGTNSGSAYVFDWAGSIWLEEQKLLPADGASDEHFGRSVALGRNQLVVGANNDDDRGILAGSAYVFRYDAARWVEEQKLLASDGTARDIFGESVSVSGGLAAVGAYYGDGITADTGSTYLFRLTDLALDIEPEVVNAGDRIYLTTCGGLTGAPVMLALVEVNGIPLFRQVLIGAFGADGLWPLSGTVPPGLAGFEFGFQSFGMVSPGKLGGSNREWVTFQ